jgi:membrane associated rhomboid family serine protease
MFPLKDENPTELVPVVTLLIIGANALAWFLVQGAGTEPALLSSLCRWGLVPAELTGRLGAGDVIQLGRAARCRLEGGSGLTVLTAMFLHGGWFHIVGNMWFLWVFGNNIEDSMGHVRFLLFYLLCGSVAAAAQVLSAPDSAVPMIGASGAISGVMGAYLVLYPRVKVYTLIFLFLFITVVALPAYVLLGFWFLLQLVSGSVSQAAGGGVAFWAHVGGFVAGVVLIPLFRRRDLVRAKREGTVLSGDELARLRW